MAYKKAITRNPKKTPAHRYRKAQQTPVCQKLKIGPIYLLPVEHHNNWIEITSQIFNAKKNPKTIAQSPYPPLIPSQSYQLIHLFDYCYHNMACDKKKNHIFIVWWYGFPTLWFAGLRVF